MRSEAEVRDALAELVTVACRAAMLPKNAEKGHWNNMNTRDLLILVVEEVGEVARAYNHGESLDAFAAEIGDAAWVLAALLDNAMDARKARRAQVLRESILLDSVKVPVMENGEVLAWPVVLEVGTAPPMPGCHLELKLLGAKDTCGACGFTAEQHRNWKGRQG